MDALTVPIADGTHEYHIGADRMKLVFRGWKREVMRHEREVRPVQRDGTRFTVQKDGPLQWSDALHAFGKVSGLGLSGDFLVHFEFNERELRNWLHRYAKEKPESALRVLAEMQVEAMISLSAAKVGHTAP